MYWLRTLVVCTTVSFAFGCWLMLGAKERASWRSLGALLASMWVVEFGAVVLTLSDRPNVPDITIARVVCTSGSLVGKGFRSRLL